MEIKKGIVHDLDNITETTLNMKSLKFLGWLVILGTLIVGISSMNFNLEKSILIAGLIDFLIIILVFLKFQSIRRKSSFEGEILMVNFLNQYRISRMNIYETLEVLCMSKGRQGNVIKLMKKMLMEIRNTGSSSRIKAATDDFADIIDTNWSKMFAYNIYMGASQGWDITTAIEDILVQLRDARILEEERSRLNSETVRIITYMIPILYALTIFLSLKFADMKLNDFMHNQFFNQEGFMFFIVTIILFLFNLILVEVVTKRKFDY